MLTMNVEIWPFGDKDNAKRLVTINLANLGRSKRGDGYDYAWTIDEPAPLFGEPIKAQGLIENYDRRASAIAIVGAIIDDFRQPKVTQLNNSDLAVVDRLRDKTLGVPLQNRWPY